MSEQEDNYRGADGRIKETSNRQEKFYLPSELPKFLGDHVTFLKMRNVQFKRAVEEGRDDLRNNEKLTESERMRKEESIILQEEAIAENERFIADYCSKEKDLTKTLLPGYKWKNEEKRVQSSIFKDSQDEPACEVCFQPDPDDPEFGALVTVQFLQGANVAASQYEGSFFDIPVDHGLYVVATLKPVTLKRYNRPSERAMKFFANRGEKGRTTTIPASLVEEMYSVPNSEAT